jgi:hypothetical protein
LGLYARAQKMVARSDSFCHAAAELADRHDARLGVGAVYLHIVLKNERGMHGFFGAEIADFINKNQVRHFFLAAKLFFS